MKKTILAALLGASLLGGGAYAAVQDGSNQAKVPADADGDGILTRQEALAAADARFARMDANHDGQIGGDERRAAHAARAAGGKHHRMGGRHGFRQQMLERFDADKDGKLSDAEREAARAARPDRGTRGAMRQQMLERFDADKDGKLSDAERQAARAAMRNARSVRAAGHAAGKGGGMKRADTDGNGSISQAEARAVALARFERMDANKDGRVDRAERRAARAQRKAMRHHRPPAPAATSDSANDS